MGFWNRWADWLPLSNAEAQVNFYEEDLKSAQDYLTKVESYAKYNLPNYHKILRIAQKDVEDSLKNLAKSRKTLENTKKRVG